ncbi:MAG: hypothetical protein IT370_14385 [Deltaproteobacteria bacterium]|nr:hypothetical protein [Deltaproteobacteria bacterium]
MSNERGAIAFAERVLALLAQARATSTYKYAVLLGLIDVCLERVDRTGHAPEMVTTRQLAEKVLELYWPHTVPFGASAPRVLHQNRSGKAEILTLIEEFRRQHARDPSAPLSRAERSAPRAHRALIENIEWKLVEMPLPRLQRFGAQDDRFIYQIDWDEHIKRRAFTGTDFSNAIRFVSGAGEHLVRLAGLLRPLLQRRWAADVASLNDDLVKDAELEEFLFGSQRIALGAVCDHLRELQGGRCFYCDGQLRKPQVDHFIPWARVPINAIENLVVADQACNGGKRDHLAATGHVERWSARLRDHGPDLRQIAEFAGWQQAPERVLGVARAAYLLLAPSALLWSELRSREQVFVAPDLPKLRRALA